MGDELHIAARSADDLKSGCDVRAGRTSGPGGQHRNKVETAVTVTHKATGVSGFASERRSQRDNKKKAFFRLRVNLAVEVRGKYAELKAGGSEMWRSRCRKGKVAVNPEHADFPAMLAEALDVMSDCEWEPGGEEGAGVRLGCSSTQLVKILKLEPRGLGRVNEEREKLDKHRLK